MKNILNVSWRLRKISPTNLRSNLFRGHNSLRQQLANPERFRQYDTHLHRYAPWKTLVLINANRRLPTRKCSFTGESNIMEGCNLFPKQPHLFPRTIQSGARTPGELRLKSSVMAKCGSCQPRRSSCNFGQSENILLTSLACGIAQVAAPTCFSSPHLKNIQ